MAESDARRLFRRRVRTALKNADSAFRGRYAAEIEGLLGLSRDEIDAITPGDVDVKAYDQLIAVVKEASRANVAQAELKSRIQELGRVAIGISQRVPGLAGLF